MVLSWVEERPVYATMRDCSRVLRSIRLLRKKPYEAPSEEASLLLPAQAQTVPFVQKPAKEEQSQKIAMEMVTCYQQMLHQLGDTVKYVDLSDRKQLQEYILQQFVIETVEDQSAILANKAISLQDRKFLFARLSAQQKRAIYSRGVLTAQDTVAFVEASLDHLAQQEEQKPTVAISVLSVVALLVCVSLIIAGPLGGILAIGTVTVATILCHYAATRMAQIGSYTHVAQSLQLQLDMPNITEREQSILAKKYQFVQTERLSQFVKLAMMIFMVGLVLVTPPPITLLVGAVFLANALGRYLEKYAHTIQSEVMRVPLLLFARLLQLPITLPTFCFTRLLPTVRAYLYSSTEVDRKVPLQQKKLTTQALVAETSKSRKNVVVGAVLDESKEKLQEESLQEPLNKWLQVSFHLGGGHSMLAFFDLIEQIEKIRSYMRQSQERAVLTELSEDLLKKFSPKGDQYDTKKNRGVEDLQKVLSTLKVSRDYLIQTLPEDMARWHQHSSARFELPSSRVRKALPKPSLMVQVLDAKMALVEAKRYLHNVEGTLQKKQRPSVAAKQALQQAQHLVSETQMRVKSLEDKLIHGAKQEGRLLSESDVLSLRQQEGFFHHGQLLPDIKHQLDTVECGNLKVPNTEDLLQRKVKSIEEGPSNHG